jgi:hypothetical protein
LIQYTRTLKVYNILQPFGHHDFLYIQLWLICSFPYIDHCLNMGEFCASLVYILVQCPFNRLSCNIKIFKY